MEKTYLVEGMTCEHCVRAVSEELGAVAGIERVSVDLDSGRVSVSGQGFADQHVADAVAEAGYQLRP
jgi:copper chaperone CopZ